MSHHYESMGTGRVKLRARDHEVCQGLSHGFMDIVTQSTYAFREDWFVDRELQSLSYSLNQQWYDLIKHQGFGEDFDVSI